MNRMITTNTIEPSETTEGSEYGSGAWNGFRGHLPKQFRDPLSGTAGDQASIDGGCSETDECTYETDEIEEPEEVEESQETEELEEKGELATLSPKLSVATDEAISECEVTNYGDTNRPLFVLANKICSIEEELNIHFS